MGCMYPVRSRQNEPDELTGAFVDDEVAGVFPSGVASDDSCGGYTDGGCDAGDSYSDGES